MHSKHGRQSARGFTLIEVLLALSVIAIALTALLKASAQAIANTERLKEKTIAHWIAMQGVYQVQLGLVPFAHEQEKTAVTTLFNQRWYWRAKLSNIGMKSVQKITLTVSKHQAGPFESPLIAFRHTNHD